MRIGVDIRALMEGKTTGVEVYVENLLRELFRIDRANEYLLFANNAGPVKLPRFDYPNVRTRLFRYPNKMFNLSQKYFAWPKVNRLLGGVDVFFSPHWRVTALDDHVRLIVTFHDLSFETVPEFFTLRQRMWHKFMDYPNAARRAQRLIAVSEATKSDLMERYGTLERKIRVIHSGAVQATAAEPLPGLPDQYFLSLGTFEPRKNHAAVLAAYNEYYSRSRVRRPLVLAGSRGWKTQLEISPRFRDSVFVARDVTEAQKSFIYQHAFAFLFLSFYEGFGFPVLEAAQSGLPVISSFAASLPEIGGDFVLPVNPFRPQEAADAMLALEAEPEYYKELQERSRRWASNYSWERSAAATLRLFKELAI